MSLGAAIFLCDLSGVMAEPWAAAGYECWCVDIEHLIRKPRKVRVGTGEINFVWGDVRSFKRPTRKEIAHVAAMTPCTHVAGSGARDFATKGGFLLRDALEMFEAAHQIASWTGAPYCLENSVGVLSTISHLGKPTFYFDPHEYAGYADDPESEAYTKRTCIWSGNGYVIPEKRSVPPILGSKMHLLTPSDDREEERSRTPQGWARANFAANTPKHMRAAA